jgi:MFS transporter, DHA3 family, macrolide efflux protein
MCIVGIICRSNRAAVEEMETPMAAIKRLWNRNFTILWQGQLISDFGNAAFAVMLSIWVLEKTGGDTVAMSLVEACYMIPGVVLGPLAGAVADRLNRKWIIVASDFIRGVLYTLIGVLLAFNLFPFWLIYPLSAIVGVCGAFFGPAISSAVPDIVPTDSLSKANSARSFSMSLTQLLGNGLGGWLYVVITAPFLILIDGFSFLYAAATQLFMKIPLIRKTSEKKHIRQDMAEGVKYAFGNRGIRTVLFTGMFINFLAVIGITLMPALFQFTDGFGIEKYGYMMCAMMAGMVVGMLALSFIKIKAAQRSSIFGLSIFIMAVALVPFGLLWNVTWMYPLAFISGATNAIVNMLLQTIMQSTIPAENRGKVFGIMGTVMQSLQPLAIIASGFIAKFAGVRPTMVVSFSILVFAVLPLLVDKSFKKFINTDIAREIPESGEPALSAEAPAALAPSEEG